MPSAPTLRASVLREASRQLDAAAGTTTAPALDLLSFTRRMYPRYETGRHHVLIADALERVAAGEVRRLMIFTPPRHGKSHLVSVHFPAWYLGRHPDRHVIATSYSAGLAYSFSRQARNLFAAPDWPYSARLARDAKAVGEWRTTDGGGYVSAGVGGPITGKGADILIIDDPVKNAEEAASTLTKEAQWEWYGSTAYTRLHPGGAIVLCMTRWAEDDLAGRLLAAQDEGGERWEVLRLPALAEGDPAAPDPLGRAPGEPLWPAWYDAAALDTIRRATGSRTWEALYQQRPVPAAGALFKRDWLTAALVGADTVPPDLHWARYWDLAASTKTTADYTASARVAIDWRTGILYVRDVIRGRWEWPDVRALIVQTALAERGTVVGVEEALHGLAAVQELRRERALAGVALVGVRVDTDKLSRALPWAARAEAGKVALVRGPWVDDFLGEACAFPYGAHDDQVDAVSGAVQLVARSAPLDRRRNRPVRARGSGIQRVDGPPSWAR